ncbi:hypothetical protein ACFL0V_01140 [Nanoarchaeota archaeon]
MLKRILTGLGLSKRPKEPAKTPVYESEPSSEVEERADKTRVWAYVEAQPGTVPKAYRQVLEASDARTARAIVRMKDHVSKEYKRQFDSSRSPQRYTMGSLTLQAWDRLDRFLDHIDMGELEEQLGADHSEVEWLKDMRNLHVRVKAMDSYIVHKRPTSEGGYSRAL